MQQKSQGTNWQQQNQKQHSKQNKQKNFETRKMFPVFWKCQKSVLKPSNNNINFQESTDSKSI